MLATIEHLNKLASDCNITGASMLNFVVTDGVSIVAIRYINDKEKAAASLVGHFFSLLVHNTCELLISGAVLLNGHHVPKTR